MEETTGNRVVLNRRINFSAFIVINPTAGEATKKLPQRSTNKSSTKELAPKAPIILSSPEPPSPKPLEKPAEKAADKPAKKTVKKVVRKSVSKPVKPVIRRFNRAKSQSQKALPRRLTELDLHYDNIKTVLRCSNATPIRCKTNNGYSCSYCSEEFVQARVLKSHTLLKHSDTNHKPECLSIRSLSKYCVHLDVTDLKCNICDATIEKLEDLVDHLKYDHDELIHSNIRNLMVPYKFETQDVRCVVCAKQFDDYIGLQDHMSEHYKNYICEFCDKAFLLRCTLIEHKKVVHQV